MVTEVLRHEMAHQIVSEIFGSTEAHGLLFKKACKMLGANPLVHRAGVSLEDLRRHLSNESNPLEEKMLRRAKKLLALADSSNEFEAALALEKAKKLAQQYHLDHHLSGEPGSYISVMICHKKKKVELWTSLLACLLTDHFKVKVVHTSLYDAQDLTTYKSFEVMGLRHHVKIAEYIYWFVCNNIKGLWNDFSSRSGKRGIRNRNQFFQGLIAGLSEQLSRLQSEKKEPPASSARAKGMILIEANRLAGFVRERYPRLRSGSVKSGIWDRDSYEAGKNSGHKLNLYGGISQKNGSIQSLPAGGESLTS